MEENVALDSKKQKKFVKSIRGIKKLIKKNEGKIEPKKKEEKVEPKKPFSMKLKHGKINKYKTRKERGLVYLSHIPHGFYEHQMTQYFKQFGVVTNVRVIRSKRTGNSKGFAFVEFKEPAVGQIVAETMNNYLMGKRLIKAAYIPPEKQKLRAFRKNWNSVNNPSAQARLKTKKAFNAVKDETGELKRARKLLSNLNKNKKRLSELGINYDFFAPVDVPEALLNEVVKQEKDENASIKEEGKPKKLKKEKQEPTDSKKDVQNEKAQNVKQIKESKGKNNDKDIKESKPVEVIKKGLSKPVEKPVKKENVTKVNKKEKVPIKVNEKQQKEKEQKLKKAGVKPAEEFIKLEESGDDSDSEYEFDSDEYEKLLEKMSEGSELSMLSDEEDDDDDGGDDDNGSDDDEESEDIEESDEEEEIPPKKVKGKQIMQAKVQPVQTKKSKKQQNVKQQLLQKQQTKQPAQQLQKKPVEVKRKAPQKPAVSPKKVKFEKQSQKPLKKQFKKK